MRHDEDSEQAALFAWAELAAITRPAFGMLVAVPNGGKRNAREAARMKRQGVSSGFPDILLPLKVGSYGGLAIELKRANGRRHDITADQYAWIGGLRAAGWYSTVAYGWDEARRVLIAYIDGALPEDE